MAGVRLCRAELRRELARCWRARGRRGLVAWLGLGLGFGLGFGLGLGLGFGFGLGFGLGLGLGVR